MSPCAYQIESLVQLKVNVLIDAQVLHVGVDTIKVVISVGGRRDSEGSPGEITPTDDGISR